MAAKARLQPGRNRSAVPSADHTHHQSETGRPGLRFPGAKGHPSRIAAMAQEKSM